MQYHDQINEPLTIEGEATVYGLITKMTTVKSGGVLKLQGMITADLLVEAGGTALISGIVDGLVINKGETLVTGIVDRIITEPDANTVIKPGAIIKNA